MDYLKKQNESHKIGDVLSPVFFPVQGLSSSQDDCGNAHIVDEKLHLSPERVWLARWPQDNDTEGNSPTPVLFERLCYLLLTSSLPEVTTLGRDGAEIQIQSGLSCAKPTHLSIRFFFQLDLNTGPAFFFLRIMESLLLISFDQLQAYVSWSKQALICRLNSYLMKKSFSQRSNKVCKEIALLKRTFNLHCQIAHWSF